MNMIKNDLTNKIKNNNVKKIIKKFIDAKLLGCFSRYLIILYLLTFQKMHLILILIGKHTKMLTDKAYIITRFPGKENVNYILYYFELRWCVLYRSYIVSAQQQLREKLLYAHSFQGVSSLFFPRIFLVVVTVKFRTIVFLFFGWIIFHGTVK